MLESAPTPVEVPSSLPPSSIPPKPVPGEFYHASTTYFSFFKSRLSSNSDNIWYTLVGKLSCGHSLPTLNRGRSVHGSKSTHESISYLIILDWVPEVFELNLI